jgi:hypothetical protein
MKPKSKRPKININDPDLDMPPLTDKQLRSFRRSTPEETEKYRRALENTFGRPFPPRIGRPPKHPDHKYRPVYMKLHPRALKWAKAEAKRRGIGYQTVINEILLRHAA